MTSLPTPTSLEEAVDQIIAIMGDEIKAQWRTLSCGECRGVVHFTAGMGLRNEWRLWEHDSPLCQELTRLGAIHGDDRSGLILSAVWHRLNGLSHDIAAEVEFNRAHWARQGVKPDGSPL